MARSSRERVAIVKLAVLLSGGQLRRANESDTVRTYGRERAPTSLVMAGLSIAGIAHAMKVW